MSRTTVYKWIYAYSDLEPGVKMVVEMESEASKTKHLLERNAELERFIGQKQLEIEYLQQTLELASAELGYDLKKVRSQVIKFFRKEGGSMSGTMQDLYLLCGISKQGHFQALQKEKLWQEKISLYVALMYQVREMHPGMGLRKMYKQFKPEVMRLHKPFRRFWDSSQYVSRSTGKCPYRASKWYYQK